MISEGLKQYIFASAHAVAADMAFDLIITGVVTESLITAPKRPKKIHSYYTVQITEGTTIQSISAVALDGNLQILVDDYVYLLKAQISQGEIQKTQYYIIGLVNEIDAQYANLSEWESFQSIQQEDTIISDKELFVPGDKELQIDNLNLFLELLNKTYTFAIWGCFNCPAKKTGSAEAEYGIKIILNNIIDKPIYLNSEYFIGQPGNLVASYQKRLITADIISEVVGSEEIVSMKIYLYSAYTDGDAVFGEDFWVKDIKLEVGTLFNMNENISVVVQPTQESKGFFTQYANDINNVVELQAIIKYNNQILSSSQIQYYWFLEDAKITSNESQYYSSLAGKGWKCLNAHKDNSYVDKAGQFHTQIVWDTNCPIITFTDKNLFPRYNNKVKCIIKTHFFKQESELFSVLNYNNYDLFAELTTKHSVTKSAEDKVLMTTQDAIEVTCGLIKTENANTIKSIVYNWYINNTLYYTHTLEKDFLNDKLIIQDDKNINILDQKSNEYNIKGKYSEINCYCTVSIYDQNSILMDIVQTNSVTLRSFAYHNFTENIRYVYNFNSAANITFTKETKELIDQCYWSTPDGFTWKEGSSGDLNSLKDLHPDEDSDKSKRYYLYYSTQKVGQSSDSGEIISLGDWSFPRIILQIQWNGQNNKWETVANAEQLETLNTFNSLTNGGTTQGLMYSEDKGVYINASYIQTGTLKVTKNNQTIFTADTETGDFSIHTNYCSLDDTEFRIHNDQLAFFLTDNKFEIQALETDSGNFYIRPDYVKDSNDKNVLTAFYLGTMGEPISGGSSAVDLIIDPSGDLILQSDLSITLQLTKLLSYDNTGIFIQIGANRYKAAEREIVIKEEDQTQTQTCLVFVKQ